MSGILLYPKLKSFLASGAVNAGGKVNTYAAGTSTPQNTYTDAALTIPAANPIILDSNGEAIVYCLPAAYKLVFTDSAGNTVPGGTIDNYWPSSAVNLQGGTAGLALQQWIQILQSDGRTAPSFGFTSSTQFTVNAGSDLIGTYGLAVGDRIRTQNNGGIVYSTITAITYGAPNNTITVVNDGSGAIDGGISALWIGQNRYLNPSYLDPRSSMIATKSGTMTGFGSTTKVTGWNAATVDNLLEWSQANSQFTNKYAGDYMINFEVEVSDTSASIPVTMSIGVGGVATYNYQFETSATAARHTTFTVTKLLTLTAGQTIQLFLAGSANTSVYGVSTAITVVRRP